MFDKPDRDAVVRSLSLLMGKADQVAADKLRDVRGDSRNNRTVIAIAQAMDKAHEELVGEAMEALASYVGQVDASPKDMTTWARSALENVATPLIARIHSTFFPDDASTYRWQYTDTFKSRVDHALQEFEFGRVRGKPISASPVVPDRPSISSRPSYVSESRIEALRAAKSPEFDTSKLVRLCEELNFNYSAGNYYSVAMLVRAVIDHVPPIFEANHFGQVAAQGSRTFKEHMDHLDKSSRKIADAFLHAHIRRSEVLPSDTQVYFAPALETLIGEVVSKLGA